MKQALKNIGKIVLLLFMVTLGSSFAKAQSHNEAAANCIYHDNYVKNAKSKVSCVDCYCKACGDKKEKEKDAKRKAEAVAKQKTATPQKKTTVTTSIKAKSSDVILVAPKPKVEENKSPLMKLSAKDQEIVELGKKTKVELKHFSKGGLNYFDGAYRDFPETVAYVYYAENGREILLKELRPIEEKGYVLGGSKLDDNGNFCINHICEYKANVKPDQWSDILTIQGDFILNDKNIRYVRYKGNGIYDLQMQGQSDATEQYNFKTKKRVPIP